MVHESNLNRDSESGRNQLFNKFMQAQTCHQTFTTFLDLCEEIDLSYPPSPSSSSSSFTEHTSFYPRLKKKLSDSWRAQSLWAKLDKRFYGKEYFVNKKTNGKRAGEHMKVAVIGAGPCGLRTAIEMACLGTKVVVLEKRDNFSRNNVLHLWPFIITDLKTLGAKKLYGRFCVGAIDHISIRQLQLILLKIALMLGVEVLVNISFEGLIPPSLLIEDQGEKGWTAAVKPANHPISNFEFDIVVGADGKRNTLQGFKRKEFRGKLAIGLTVNFINRNTTADAKVEEISGVAYIFNQQFFKDLQKETGIDLENIVYYKGETHYFVMTAKKHSLVTKGVLKQDYDDTSRLLSYQNVDMQAMMTYAREAADFSTHHQLPSLEFAINKHGQPDIALFDFTCMYAAENAALFREVNGHKLLSCLVGDSLLEPFWPMGTGCARGFLAAFDTAWMTRQWATNRTDNVTSGRNVELQVLAERESIYRLLHQTTPQNTMKKFAAYTIDPNTRYVNLNMKAVSPNQVKVYYLADCEVPDVPDNFKKVKPIAPVEPEPEKRPHSRSTLTRKVSMVRSSKLQSWCQHTTEGYRGVHVTDMTSSWKSGLAICALIHRFRPDLINWNDLDGNNVENNNQLAFDIAEAQLGISPVMTGKEMQECDKVDKLLMVTYISQFYEIFKHETATGIPPSIAEEEDVKEDTEEIRKPRGVSLTSPVGLLTRIHQHIKRRSVQNKHDDHAKKKKHGHSLFKKKEERTNVPDPHLSVVHESQTQDKPREQRNEIAPDESESMEIGGTNVKLRPKKNLLDESSSPKATVHQRASNRISALSNQLISQWEQNAPQASPRTTKKNKEADDLLELPVPSASDKCYFCQRRVYIVERLSAEGFFFHRQCFVCSHCGLTLRRGAYVFEKDTGKFFCHASCMEQSKTCQHPPKPQTETDALQTNGEPNKKNNFQTPERIELENIRMSMINDPEELSEEALTKHNFSTSAEPDPETMPDVDYMSDSSDDDIDWEDVLRKAKVAGENENKEEEFEYDENDSLVSHSSLEGSNSSNDINNITTMSWIPDDPCNVSQEQARTISDIPLMMSDILEDLSGNRRSLVKRKTVSNLTSIQSFEELHKVKDPDISATTKNTHKRLGSRKKPLCLYNQVSKRNTSDSTLHTENYKLSPLEILNAHNRAHGKNTLEPLKSDKISKRLFSPEKESYETVDAITRKPVYKPEKEAKKKKSNERVPYGHGKYYLPRKELSVFLSLSRDHLDSYQARVDYEKKEAIFETLRNWLSGSVKHKKSKKRRMRTSRKTKDSEASDASVADLSSHDSLSDIPDENESQEDNEDETLLSSESSSSIGSQDSLVSHDSIPKDIPPTAKETAEASTLKDVKTGSNRDSLSSVSTSSEIEELPREKVQDGRDVTLVVSTNLQTKTGAQQEVAKKSKTIFGLLSEVVGKSENSKSDQKSEKPQKLPEPAKETNPKQINKFETLDRFQDYLRNTPLDDHSLSDQEEGSTEEDSQESFSSSSSISLSSSRSDIDNDALLDLLEEKETKTEVPISLVVQQSLQQHEEEREKAVYPKKFPKTPRPSVRVLPRQSSVDSILLRASNSLKNNTSVWSTFEGHEESTNTDNRDGDVDESLISNYRPCKDVTDSAGAQPRPPLERRLSYDSLERRMKFRLRARNRWLRQESVDKSGRGLTRSHSERTSKSSSTPADDNRSKDDLASYFESRGMVVIESSPPIETYSTPPSKPVEDHEDSFHTPLVDISLEQIPDFIPEAFSISSQKPVARKLNLDGSGNFVLAPGSPADDQKSQTLPTSSRRMLPALPKVPHLEAISPTGSANNTLNRKKKDKLEEDFKAREQRVKERVEKIKAETLKRKKQTLDVASPSVDASKSSREPMKSLDVAEGSPTGSGYSPKPTRKHLFKTKRTKKSKSQEDEEPRIKRSLPVPHVKGEPLSEVQQNIEQKENKDSHGKKVNKTSNLDKKSDNHRSKSVSTAAVEEKKNKGFFRISPRKKHQKKENKLVSMDVVDGGNTLERKYKTQSEREKAILRGERFRILPDTPSTSQPIRADSYDSPDEEESKNYWARKRRVTLAGLTPAQIDAKITRRVQIAARRQAKLEAQKRLRRAQVIQRQLEEVEVKQKNLEERGVVLEKLVRGDGEEKEESNHMQEWFKMVQEKNGLLRYENELMIYQRELQLEDVQSRLQQELRERMAMDDQRKTSAELAQEKEILRKMLDVVEQRDELVALLEEQRLKERDESIDPETLMLNKFNGISEDSSSHSVSSS